MIVLSKKFGVTPQNLVRIINQFIIDYRFQLLKSGGNYSDSEKTCRFEPPEVFLDNKIVGWAYAIPLTDVISRVVVEANADPGEDVTQMRKLSDYILEIVTDNELINNDAIAHTSHLKGGRPKNEANEFAYYQVNILGRSPAEVYKEWVIMRGETISLLVDPRDSFRKAIRKKPN
jgi:hypothetical protein